MSRMRPNTVAYLSTYPPRECGIATFTRDLATAFDERFNPLTASRIIAINETQTSLYRYSERVADTIAANNLEHYVELAERLNRRDAVKIISVQHEFGIFGGRWGDYLVPFLQVVKKPVVVTFHSVLLNPDDEAKRSVQLVATYAKALVVMNARSRDMLVETYGVPRYKIKLIPHGIPDVTFETPRAAKEALGFGGKLLLSTFGMLSRNKGIEQVIRAMPRIVSKFPNVVYLVLGETHPVVRRGDGEIYRNFLNAEVERLRLKNHVLFYNKYLTVEEIVQYLKATDIYLYTPTDAGQSVSGTLSYALGCGRAVVGTATEYAKHLITPDRNGILVGFSKPGSVVRAVTALLSDEKLLRLMHKHAYESTRHMTWPNVAGSYFRLYQKFADIETESRKLPTLKLNHLVRLTNDFGIMHHARYSKPERRYGYSVDDNARALIVAALAYRITRKQELIDLVRVYLRFLEHMQRARGTFSNIANAQRRRGAAFEEDTQGRAIWALGFISAEQCLPSDVLGIAEKLLTRAIPAVSKLTAPRAIAFAMTGLYYRLTFRKDRIFMDIFRKFAEQQFRLYRENATADWQWFEDHFTYSNSKLSESLYYAAALLGGKRYLAAAEASLRFLSSITFESGRYVPIGQNGWYFRNRARAYFDQQPEDAASMVETKIVAYRITKKAPHLTDAFTAFQWFLGKNHLHQMVYNEVTGGCHDGVGRYAINLNQGAESTISYLLARLLLEACNKIENVPKARTLKRVTRQ